MPPLQFQHDKLELTPGSIRFLEIESKDENGKVNCLLRPGSTHSDTYTALSYTWGSADHRRNIHINGDSYKVRDNLLEFLSQACGLETFRGRLLWIDAICIDQDFIEERNHQVRQMSQIFSQAQEVLVWLGCGNNDIFEVIDAYDWLTLREVEEKDSKNEWSRHIFEWHASIKLAWRSALHLEYWSRTWIIQELMLAKTISLMYGTKVVDWNKFWDGCFLVQNIEHPQWCNVQPPKVWSSRQRYCPRQTPLKLRDALSLGSKSGCSDVRDQLFALLSFVKKGENFLIDYAESPAQVALKCYAHFEDQDDPTLFAKIAQRLDLDFNGIKQALIQTYGENVAQSYEAEVGEGIDIAGLSGGKHLRPTCYACGTLLSFMPVTLTEFQSAFQMLGFVPPDFDAWLHCDTLCLHSQRPHAHSCYFTTLYDEQWYTSAPVAMDESSSVALANGLHMPD